MTSIPVGGTIRLAARSAEAPRPGETVVVSVIKLLDPGKWAVGVQGRVYPASSSLPLHPGDVLRARVVLADGGIALIVSDTARDAVQAVLQGQGLPRGGVEELIARTLARAGLPIQAESVRTVRELLTRAPALEARKAARIGAALLDRGIPPAGDAARELLPVLGLGQKGAGDPRRWRRQPLPDSRRAVKAFVEGLAAAPAAGSPALAAFNHAAARSQQWVVIPFCFNAGARDVTGTLKILFDPHRARPIALSLCAEGIAFHLPLQGARKRLAIFCDDGPIRRAAEARLGRLKADFDNLGLDVDDTIREGETFDGFSPVDGGESLPSVDLVG
jgi:hypothetical protein